MIEAKALQHGCQAAGKRMEDVVVYHAVAAKYKEIRELDETVQVGHLPGTWYSGDNWDEAIRVGNLEYSRLKKDDKVP
jgi:hypothetical protein